ncbi:Lamina-associated polypeptide 2, isoform alpha [Labeo rohita]|uniref:ribonuclease H n=1 Tax=Labeo rohita TaxID=84645 RepID=A0ABQ8KYZ7_LABRO|nr:Lamina-associated polypeptide 2, isoform alpha [Labeo rohita]
MSKKCLPPCVQVIPDDDPHDYCLECLGEEHAAAALQDSECEHCESLSIGTLRLMFAFFEEGCLRDERHSKRPSPFRSPQIVMTPPSLKRASAAFLQCEDARGFSCFLETESATSERSSRDDRAFEELLEVVSHKVARLKLDWPQEQENPRHSKLDDRFLSDGQGRDPSVCLFPFSQISMTSYLVHGVEETLAGYLSPGSSSSLKKPAVPTKPCRLTSTLVGKTFQAAGQAGAALHTMGVLQAYQADLLKDLSTGGSISEEAFLELCRATDLSLRATKQTAHSISRSMTAMVAAERHLWLNLTGIKDRDKIFLLDAPVSTSGLFGDSVNTVVTRFREAKRHTEAFDQFLPRRAQVSGLSATQPRPSQVPLRRESQKTGSGSPHSTAQQEAGSEVYYQGQKEVLRVMRPGPWGCAPSGRGAKIPAEIRGSFPAPSGDKMYLAKCYMLGHRTSNIPQISEVSKLVPLSEKLATWKLLPDISPWVVRTVEKGYRIQFAYRPPRFNGVVSTSTESQAITADTFWFPRKMGAASNFGSSRVKPLPQNLQVQDANNQNDCFPDPVRGLVRDNRSQGHIFPCRNFATTQEVPEGIHILNYIDDWLILARSHELALRHRDVILTHLRSLGLRLNAKKSVLSPAQRTMYLGVVWDLITMQAQLSPARSFRSHGSCIHDDTFGPSAHETVSVVAQSQGISSKGQSPEANKGYAPGASYPFYVVQTPVSDFGSHSRSVLSSQDANDRRFPHGLGCGLKWPSSPRDLERSSSQLAHQLPRNDGCISGPEILPPAVKKLPCPSAGGQYRCGLLHKLPGRTAVAPPEQASTADSALGTGQVPVPQSDLYSGAYEHGSRLSVQTSCDTRGMETPPRSSQSNLGKILRSRGGPLCFTGDSTTSPLLLSDSSSSPGSGRDGPYVAQTASVHISPECSAPGSPSQGPSTGVWPLIDSAPLADQSMVLRSNIPPRRLAVGDSSQERSPISGAGDNISSPAWNLHVWPLRGTN